MIPVLAIWIILLFWIFGLSKKLFFTDELSHWTRLNTYVTDYIEYSKIEDKRVKDSHATDKIKELTAEMERTTKAYRKGRITEAEYDKEYEEMETRLQELQTHLEPVVERDLTQYEELLKSDWIDLYNALTRENKRAFWRKYIKEIHVGNNSTVLRVIFF